jgi:hypothetical protein
MRASIGERTDASGEDGAYAAREWATARSRRPTRSLHSKARLRAARDLDLHASRDDEAIGVLGRP